MRPPQLPPLRTGEGASRGLVSPARRLSDRRGLLGPQVWARWSGIKFSHGVISKVLTSSKWILVTFDNDTSQWVTVRDIVIDTKPEPSAVAEGVEW